MFDSIATLEIMVGVQNNKEVRINRNRRGKLFGKVMNYVDDAVETLGEVLPTELELYGVINFKNNWVSKVINTGGVSANKLEFYVGRTKVGEGILENIAVGRYRWTLSLGLTDIKQFSASLINDLIDKRFSIEYVTPTKRQHLWGIRRE